MLNRWQRIKKDMEKDVSLRPYLASECKDLSDAERWRRDVMKVSTMSLRPALNLNPVLRRSLVLDHFASCHSLFMDIVGDAVASSSFIHAVEHCSTTASCSHEKQLPSAGVAVAGSHQSRGVECNSITFAATPLLNRDFLYALNSFYSGALSLPNPSSHRGTRCAFGM